MKSNVAIDDICSTGFMSNSNPALSLMLCMNFSRLERWRPKSANIENNPYSSMMNNVVMNDIANTLAEIGGEEINEHLMQLLIDKKLKVQLRRAIATALTKQGEQSIMIKLRRLLLIDPNLFDPFYYHQLMFSSRLFESQSYVPRSVLLFNKGPKLLGESMDTADLLQRLSDEQVDTDTRIGIVDELIKFEKRPAECACEYCWGVGRVGGAVGDSRSGTVAFG